MACYWTDALVFYVKCEEFAGHSAVQFILNVPLQMLYLPMFGLYGIADPAASMTNVLLMLGLATVYWIPLLYLVAYVVAVRLDRKRSTRAAQAQ